MAIHQSLLSQKPDAFYTTVAQFTGQSNASVNIGEPSPKRIVVVTASSGRGSGLTNTITGILINGVAANLVFALSGGNVSGGTTQMAMGWLEVPSGTTCSVSFSLAAGSNVVSTSMEVGVIYNYENPTPTVSTNGAQNINGNGTLTQVIPEKAGGVSVIACLNIPDTYTASNLPNQINTSESGRAAYHWTINRVSPMDQTTTFTYLTLARQMGGCHWR